MTICCDINICHQGLYFDKIWPPSKIQKFKTIKIFLLEEKMKNVYQKQNRAKNK